MHEFKTLNITYKICTVRFVGPPAGLGPLESPCTNVVWFDLAEGCAQFIG
jgi:hypothetical protein